VTTATLYAEEAAPVRTRRVPLRRLMVIELRKMADTRAGIALLGLTVLIALIMMFVLAFAAKPEEQTLDYFFRNTLQPMGALLPVVGILAATSEWSQRTALSTFTLVPQRGRIAAAKTGAIVLLAIPVTAFCVLTSVVGNAIAASRGGNGSWDITAAVLGQGLLGQLIGILMGLAFGLVLMSSPLAIVSYYLVPTVLQILGGAISAITKPLHWIDTSALSKLADDHVTNHGWAQVGTTVALWVLLPLVVGLIRLAKREIK
jgi:ABC-2 type transport system permease protein